jgi:hypothetical protein
MPDVEATLYSYLSTYAGLAALVSTRIYPMQLPQNVVLPACTYQKISGARTHSSSGTSILARPRVQIDTWATTYTDAKAVAAQVRLALDGHHGTGSAWASILDNEIDDYDPVTTRYRVICDILLWFVD